MALVEDITALVASMERGENTGNRTGPDFLITAGHITVTVGTTPTEITRSLLTPLRLLRPATVHRHHPRRQAMEVRSILHLQAVLLIGALPTGVLPTADHLLTAPLPMALLGMDPLTMDLHMTVLLTADLLAMVLLRMRNRLRTSLHTTDLQARTDPLTDLQAIIVRLRHLTTAHLPLLTS
jgi:hypothetical protein